MILFGTFFFPEPRFLIDYIQNLKSSEKSLKEQLEIAKRKEASCIVQYAKREQEMAELKSAVRDLKSQLKPASMQVYSSPNVLILE
jgi:hypothetical protein